MGVSIATGVAATSLPPLHPGVRTGTIYYMPQSIVASTAVATATINTLYYQPISLVGTVNRIGIEVTTGVAGGARLGIYSNLNGIPSSLLVDAGIVDVTSIAVVEATIASMTFNGEWVWLAAVFEVAAACRSGAISNASLLGVGTTSTTARSILAARTYGALPAAAVAPTGFSNTGPAVFLRSA